MEKQRHEAHERGSHRQPHFRRTLPMNRVSFAMATVALYLACAGQAWAEVVMFNDYGPAYTYNTGSGYTVNGSSAPGGGYINAEEFIPVTTGSVSSVAFGIS